MEDQRVSQQWQQQDQQNRNDRGRQQDLHDEENPSAPNPQMEIQEDELRWAHEIKAAISADSKLSNLTDYEYAQWAIVTLPRQDMDEVFDRVYKLQHFVKEYRILQSTNKSFTEEGVETMARYMKMLPGWLLSISNMPNHGHYVLIVDHSAIDPSKINTEQDWRLYLGGFYYILQMMNSNLAAVRKGIAVIVECMDMGFHNLSQHVVERTATDLFAYYPCKHNSARWLNTPTAANVILSLIKHFLPEEVTKSFQMGCKLHGYEEKIDKLFKSPTPEMANASLLVKIESYLAERQNNQLNFRLPPLPYP